jgi:mRNA-degrading endonuclease RelE of RelBE toxin-antitoxin system
MTPPERTTEIALNAGVVDRMLQDSPTPHERAAIKAVLLELKTINSGYKILFYEPETYRLDVGRFRIHYRLGDGEILVDFIGVY